MKTKTLSALVVLFGFSLVSLTGCPLFDLCGNVTCEEGFTCNPVDGACKADPCEDGTCDDASDCTEDACGDGGTCIFTNICGDDEICVENKCVDPCEELNCDDQDACTEDSCADALCSNVAINCDDGDACTENSCTDGDCVFTAICEVAMSLEIPGEDCLGNLITIEFWMRDLASQPATGFQAFLEFDPNFLNFDDQQSSYNSDIFSLHITNMDHTLVSPGQLNLDGADPTNVGTANDMLLATLIFTAMNCGPATIGFRAFGPFVSELSFEGVPIPTHLIDTPPCEPCVDLCAGNICDDGDACTTDICDSADGSCTNEAMVCDEGMDCVDAICVDLCADVTCDDEDDCTDDSCSHGECANEEILCEEGHACLEGECVDECKVVNFECDDGFVCNLGACVEDLCANGGPECLEGFSCNPVTGVCDPDHECAAAGEICIFVCVEGECVDLCEDVTCDEGTTCDPETGDCVGS